jgi:uncharacterized membrane protein
VQSSKADRPGGRRWGRAFNGIVAVLSAGVALFSYRYLLGVGPRSPAIMANLCARPWLTIHIAGAATALLLGAAQFLPVRRPTRWHRWVGRAYVVGCMFGGVAGLVIAFGTLAGPIAGTGFAGLALTWITVNVLGWRCALLGRFAEHGRWMIRSWSLTLAAVTLRIYLPLAPHLGFTEVGAYRAISFICWIPNLIIAEVYLCSGRRTVGGWGESRSADNASAALLSRGS